MLQDDTDSPQPLLKEVHRLSPDGDPSVDRQSVGGLGTDPQPPPESRLDRRAFLKATGLAGAAFAGGASRGEAAAISPDEPFAVLVDTTRCEGCRTCEYICSEGAGLPEPEPDDSVALTAERTPTVTQWSVVSRHQTSRGEVFVKRQCMHCLQPACGAACLTRALRRTDEGAVVWREGKCMGCRFCMISCPFDNPRFEYSSVNPKIQKCSFCSDRLQRGEAPACVENCPGEALFFGPRAEVLREARRRIVESPDRYVDHIYGEREAGGTSWLYLASVPFSELGFPAELGEDPYPELTQVFLYSVPVVLALWPAFLLGLSRAVEARAAGHEETPPEVKDPIDDLARPGILALEGTS